jgi:hypothetical protein
MFTVFPCLSWNFLTGKTEENYKEKPVWIVVIFHGPVVGISPSCRRMMDVAEEQLCSFFCSSTKSSCPRSIFRHWVSTVEE